MFQGQTFGIEVVLPKIYHCYTPLSPFVIFSHHGNFFNPNFWMNGFKYRQDCNWSSWFDIWLQIPPTCSDYTFFSNLGRYENVLPDENKRLDSHLGSHWVIVSDCRQRKRKILYTISKSAPSLQNNIFVIIIILLVRGTECWKIRLGNLPYCTKVVAYMYTYIYIYLFIYLCIYSHVLF